MTWVRRSIICCRQCLPGKMFDCHESTRSSKAVKKHENNYYFLTFFLSEIGNVAAKNEKSRKHACLWTLNSNFEWSVPEGTHHAATAQLLRHRILLTATNQNRFQVCTSIAVPWRISALAVSKMWTTPYLSHLAHKAGMKCFSDKDHRLRHRQDFHR